MTLKEVKQALRNGHYAWPGGYPLYFICRDGQPLSFASARENWKPIVGAYLVTGDNQWLIEACEINYEDDSLYCSHSNEKIESAYSE